VGDLLKRLTVGTFNYGLGQALPQLLGFLLIPLYTLYLSPQDYGILEICTSLIAFLVVLTRLGVPGAVVRYYYDHQENDVELKRYISTVYYFLIASSVTFSVITLAVCFYFQEQIFSGVNFNPYLLLAVIIALLSYSSDLQRRLIQVQEQSRYSAILSITFSVSGILLTLLFVVAMEMKVYGMLLAQLINAIIFWAQANFYLRQWIVKKFDVSFLKSSLSYGTALLPGHLLTSFAPLFSKSILSALGSLPALGIYSIAYRFITPLTLIYTAFNAAFQPVFFSLRKKGDAEVPRLLLIIWIFSVGIFVLAILLGPPLVKLIIPDSFEEASYLVPILAWGFLGQAAYLIFTSEIFFQKKTRYMPLITVTGTTANILLSYILVKSWGAIGLAWATSAGFIIMGLLGALIFNKISSYRIQWINFFFFLFLAIVIFIGERLFFQQDLIFRSGIAIIFIVALVVVNREYIKNAAGLFRTPKLK